VIDYDEQGVREKKVQDLKECAVYRDKKSITWINIDGINRMDVIEEIGSQYGVHPLVLEDITSAGQRPKMEDFRRYLFIELNMLIWDQDQAQIITEQVSLILAENYVVTFQEDENDVFGPVRQRLQEDVSRLVNQGTDYLVYTLIDAIVDHYFIIIISAKRYVY